MSDAGDDIVVDAPVEEVEVPQEAPKGKLSVEEALQVRRPTPRKNAECKY
jgi:small subunit ribosomal protein S12e